MSLLNLLFVLTLILVAGVVYLIFEEFHRSEDELMLRLSHIQRQLASSAYSAYSATSTAMQASVAKGQLPTNLQVPKYQTPSSCEQSGFFNVGPIQEPDTRCA